MVDPELNPDIPDFDLQVTEIRSESRKFQHPLPAKPEPAAIDRLAAITDPEAAERVAEVDGHNARAEAGEMVDTLWSCGDAVELRGVLDD